MSLATPDKIRDLQIKLYRKAKNQPGFRFYQLYDKVYREDILQHAYARTKANGGAPGVDGESFQDIESGGLEGWLNGLRKDLHDKTYQPGYPLGPVIGVKIAAARLAAPPRSVGGADCVSNSLWSAAHTLTPMLGPVLGPVRRKLIPKPGGGERALGIPTIRDRVAQTAAKLILEPIWEADLEDTVRRTRA